MLVVLSPPTRFLSLVLTRWVRDGPQVKRSRPDRTSGSDFNHRLSFRRTPMSIGGHVTEHRPSPLSSRTRGGSLFLPTGGSDLRGGPFPTDTGTLLTGKETTGSPTSSSLSTV